MVWLTENRLSSSRLLGPTSTGPTSEENSGSPSGSSWLVEMLMSNSSGLSRSSSRTLQMRFVESGAVSRGSPAGAGLAVLLVWLLFLSDEAKRKKFTFLGRPRSICCILGPFLIAFGLRRLETPSSHSTWIENLCSCSLASFPVGTKARHWFFSSVAPAQEGVGLDRF